MNSGGQEIDLHDKFPYFDDPLESTSNINGLNNKLIGTIFRIQFISQKNSFMGAVPNQTLLICYYRKKSHKISQPRNSSYVHILSNVTIEMISIGNMMQYLMNLEFKSSF